MSQTNKRTRAARLVGQGIEGSMSRSVALGADDPRNRIGADRELSFSQRFNPDEFELDAEGRVSLRTVQTPTTRLVEIDIFGRHNPTAGVRAEIRHDAFAHGAQFILGDSDEMRGAMWMIPNDLDRTRDALLHLRWYRRTGGVNTGSTVSYDVDVLAWQFEQDIDSTLDLALEVVDGVLPGLGEERGTTLSLPAGPLFGPEVKALKFRIRRVASTSDAPDTSASAPILHFFGIEYPLAHYHTHE